MRCLISLVLGLLALEVALARNLEEQVFNSVQFMSPEASPIEGTECINCQTNEECAQNAMCCPGSCGRTCKTPVNIGVPKAGFCPWNLLQMITAGPCPKKIECFSDHECSGNMKCCNVDCVMKCTPPVPVITLQ
ncbi:whey acidic protein isoform X2 [Mus caroli]|uniref:Whey acidic protein isoform X2 n=1 Tax=Mus caroli TaxID=10089 RepID=A0A6P5QTU1_MUSCR|nr:whey acidic protein isoform X2 [Mus caroli]